MHENQEQNELESEEFNYYPLVVQTDSWELIINSDGSLKISGIDIPDAAKEFWHLVAKSYPEFEKSIIDNYLAKNKE